MFDPSLRRFNRRGRRLRPPSKSHEFLGKQRPECIRPAPVHGAGHVPDPAAFCVQTETDNITDISVYLYKVFDG
jgi:hypothetical protein